MADLELLQRVLCVRFEAQFYGCDLRLKLGVSRAVRERLRPLNGLRMPPENGTSGWYIWAGEAFSDADDFFVPLHGEHLDEWAPAVLPYLALPPGWRFLIDGSYEDVWHDEQLLR
ncbi:MULTISPECIES: immunity protein Imm33 domain-containing protein [unclassified Mesorhizobium]|uniref:immunity protein Imm33 domain-containing protein n=1 Tax=unclassified Mesorhizobium TaxID=325217 RepID=UPI003015149F